MRTRNLPSQNRLKFSHSLIKNVLKRYTNMYKPNDMFKVLATALCGEKKKEKFSNKKRSLKFHEIKKKQVLIKRLLALKPE